MSVTIKSIQAVEGYGSLVAEVRQGNRSIKLSVDEWQDESPLMGDMDGGRDFGLVMHHKLSGCYAPEVTWRHEAVTADDDNGEKFARMIRIFGGVVLPVYMYEHSGRAFSSVPYNDRWDSCCIGYIFMSGKYIKENYNTTRKTGLRMIIKTLQEYIRTLSAYVGGSCFCASVEEDGEVVDNCGGYYWLDDDKFEDFVKDIDVFSTCREMANEMVYGSCVELAS